MSYIYVGNVGGKFAKVLNFGFHGLMLNGEKVHILLLMFVCEELNVCTWNLEVCL